MFMIDDILGGWMWYRRLRGGRWQYNQQWGWIRDEKRKPYPDLGIEDYRGVVR